MHCQHICKYYKKIEARTIPIYRTQIRIDEDRRLKVYIDKFDKGLGNSLFSIRVVELYKRRPIFEETLVINREGGVFNFDRLYKCICRDGESIDYDGSRFFSINELGEYRNRTIFRTLYNILNNSNLEINRKNLDMLILYILKDGLKKSTEQII